MGETEERQNYINYAIVLTILSHAAMFIGNAFFLSRFTAFGVHFGVGYYMVSGAIQLALAIASLYFIPQIMAAIAPSFGGENNSLNALKLYAFAMTPVWIGSILGIIPVVGWLGAIAGALYGVFLFWQHVTEAMQLPAEKKIGYVIVTFIAIVLIGVVIGAIGGGIAGAMFTTSQIL